MSAGAGANVISPEITLLEWHSRSVVNVELSNISSGGTVSTIADTTRLFNEENQLLATGTINDFTLSENSSITGLFTGVAGIYSIVGTINSVSFLSPNPLIDFSWFDARDNIVQGALSLDFESGGLVLSGSSLVLAPEPMPEEVPLPPAVWLFVSALLGLSGVQRRSCLSAA